MLQKLCFFVDLLFLKNIYTDHMTKKSTKTRKNTIEKTPSILDEIKNKDFVT